MKKPSDDLIGALVLKAKEGDSGESENARRTLKKMCEKHDLDFDEIMSGGEKVEYHFLYFKRGHKELAMQIIARYALTKEHMTLREHRDGIAYAYECTLQRHIETIHAYEVLAPLFNKEKRKVLKAFHFGFLDKHQLYPQFTIETNKDKEESEEEMQARLRGSLLSRDMEDAVISPRLEGSSV